jgi:hypothetical protein
VARAVLGAAMAAFTHWAADGTEDLSAEVDRAFRLLATGFDQDRMARRRRRPDRAERDS